jgi:predicted O-methyltransferase YrrM
MLAEVGHRMRALPARISAATAGRRDAKRLQDEHPDLAPPLHERNTLEAEFSDAYETYTNTVSPSAMAASLHACAYLMLICRAARASRVLDLGSGASSLALRTYAASAPHRVEVVSVDDSDEWLKRTRRFLQERDLAFGELVAWGDFRQRSWDPFDVVFHDLAGGELREAAMTVAAQHVSSGGLLLFDDAHHSGHRREMERTADHHGFALYSVRHWTHDEHDRYDALAIRG